jgi:hypothetical protein
MPARVSTASDSERRFSLRGRSLSLAVLTQQVFPYTQLQSAPGDAVALLFKRKTPIDEQVKFDIFQVALARFRVAHNAVAETTVLCAANAFMRSFQAGP